MNNSFFTYNGYRLFLKKLKIIGKVSSFNCYDQTTSFILRHDVDLDLRFALKMAEIELEENLSSTFFVLTTAETYNVLSSYNKAIIQKISDMGFEIGLHFDPSVYPDLQDEQLITKVAFEATLLESISLKKVNSVSLHIPSKTGLYPSFPGYLNAYDPPFFNNDNYISDSRMEFRGKNINTFIEEGRTRMIQINLHPMHYQENESEYVNILYKHIISYINSIDDNFKSNNSTYLSQFKGRLRDMISGVKE